MNIDIDNGPELEDLIEVQKQRTETLKEMAEQSVLFYNDFEEYDANAAKKASPTSHFRTIKATL